MTSQRIRTGHVGAPAEGLSIGEAAAQLGLTVDTLRYYDHAGLTDTPRNASGQRRYYQRQVDWLEGIIMLRQTGMTISGIRKVAALTRVDGTETERLALFKAHRLAVTQSLENIQRHLTAIDRKIAAYQAITEEEE